MQHKKERQIYVHNRHTWYLGHQNLILQFGLTWTPSVFWLPLWHYFDFRNRSLRNFSLLSTSAMCWWHLNYFSSTSNMLLGLLQWGRFQKFAGAIFVESVSVWLNCFPFLLMGTLMSPLRPKHPGKKIAKNLMLSRSYHSSLFASKF